MTLSTDEQDLSAIPGALDGFHPIWLRERCRCADCLDAGTDQRIYEPVDAPLDLALLGTRPLAGGWVAARFSDGHEARLDPARIAAEIAAGGPVAPLPAPILWDARLSPLPEADFAAVRSDRAALARLLDAFLSYGFALVRGVPARPGGMLDFTDLVGPVRETNFGRLFDVRSVARPNDLAYTTLGLELHTDNPYRDPVPGVQLLHCLVSEVTGGLSTLADGFMAAERLRTEDSGAWNVLTRVRPRFRFTDAEAEVVSGGPVIGLDADGAYAQIRFSPRVEYVPALPRDELDQYYRARAAFLRHARSDDLRLRFRLEPGDCLVMDNHRTLHGRTSYDARQGDRHLQGCYLDKDAFASRHRVLARAS